VLLVLTLAFGAPWILVVALKTIAAENGGLGTVPALASSLAWFGLASGGVVMGWVAERAGTRITVIFGSIMICAGLALSRGPQTWQLYLGQGLLVGFLGIGSMNAPFYVYVSRWFDRHRGSALALISSGAYMAGAVWPPVFERVISYAGWRQTMLWFGVCQLLIIAPFTAIFLRAAPDPSFASGQLPHGSTAAKRVLGWPANLVFALMGVGAYSAACRWPCRRRICPRFAAISAIRPHMGPRWSPSSWAARSSVVNFGASLPIASAVLELR